MIRSATDESRQVYLLYCWLERPATLTEQAVWRFSIEKIETSQSPPAGCASLEALIAFLRVELWGDAATELRGDDEPSSRAARSPP